MTLNLFEIASSSQDFASVSKIWQRWLIFSIFVIAEVIAKCIDSDNISTTDVTHSMYVV